MEQMKKKVGIYKVGNLCVLLLTLYNTFVYFQNLQNESKDIVICGFGSAENTHNAIRTARQWPRINFWFAVWNETGFSRQTVHLRNNQKVFLIDGSGTSHAEGWAKTVAEARKHTFCNYFFSMDDDLEWYITDVGKKFYPRRDHTQILRETLLSYSPAVMVFGWPGGDANIPELMQFNEKHKNDKVQVATGFDNGCVVFHKDIIDFFVPLWLGKDFKPSFIVQHPYLNFFIPFIFKGHAIRNNALAFTNPAKIRHVYEDDSKIKQYLRAKSKCRHKQWGPSLTLNDVTWKPIKGNGVYCLNLLKQISTFFPITESIIADHPIYQHLDKSIFVEMEKNSMKETSCQTSPNFTTTCRN
jgi:hypothetical protein